MTKLSTSEKLAVARIFANSHAENGLLKVAMRKLVFAARTSGGTAGRDQTLCAACDEAEALLSQ